MQVKAIRMGYYQHKRRREDHVFELAHIDDFSHHWMEALDFEPPKYVGPKRVILGTHLPTVKSNKKEEIALSKASVPTGNQSVI